MTRQLLEAAARATGKPPEVLDVGSWCGTAWNPKDDDGDMARMETALRLDGPHWDSYGVWYGVNDTTCNEYFADHPDANAARRMAALRAAASLSPKETK